jgi:hypothetical protein
VPLTPLFRPAKFFAAGTPSFTRVVFIVCSLSLVSLGTLFGAGWVATNTVDGTVVAQNTDRPTQMLCSQDTVLDLTELLGCERPAQVEQNVDQLIWSLVAKVSPIAFLAVPVAWFVIGTVLHVLSWLAPVTRTMLDSYAIAAWGLVPLGCCALTGLVTAHFLMDPVTATTVSSRGEIVTLVLARTEPVQAASSRSGGRRLSSCTASGRHVNRRPRQRDLPAETCDAGCRVGRCLDSGRRFRRRVGPRYFGACFL